MVQLPPLLSQAGRISTGGECAPISLYVAGVHTSLKSKLHVSRVLVSAAPIVTKKSVSGANKQLEQIYYTGLPVDNEHIWGTVQF